MTRTVETVQSELDALREVVGSGAKRVRFADGRETEYRSGKDLDRAIAALEDELAVLRQRAQPRTVVGVYRSGLA